MTATIDKTAKVPVAYLRSLGPDRWHCLAANLDWEDTVDDLKWMVGQPDCERATVQVIFWKAVPSRFLPSEDEDQDTWGRKVRDFERDDGFRMLRQIIENCSRGFYTRDRLSGWICVGEFEGRSRYWYPLNFQNVAGGKFTEDAKGGKVWPADPGGHANTLNNLFRAVRCGEFTGFLNEHRVAQGWRKIYGSSKRGEFIRAMLEYRAKEARCERDQRPWTIPDWIGRVLPGRPADGRGFDTDEENIALWEARKIAQNE